MDIKTAPQFAEEMEGALEDIDDVVFDLEKTAYTSSAGLRVLLKVYQTIRKKNGKMVLENVNKDFYTSLKYAGFTSFLEVKKAGE